MGKLKPIGSEKLQGIDKINRMIEISRYRENRPSNLNETSNVEYGINLSDDNKYMIVKEKLGYIIKRGLNESTSEYIEPIKNRKYYKSYSQALKRMNLLAAELNRIHENHEGISLFGEQQKFVLKNPSTEKNQAPAPPSAPPEVPSPELPPSPLDTETQGENPEANMDMPEPDMTGGEFDDNAQQSMDDDVVTFRTIQKLTGKLTQKIRQFEDKEGLTSENIKYVINMVLSSVNLENLSSEDKEDIMSKFEVMDEFDTGMDGDESELSPEMNDFGGEISPEEQGMPSGGEVAEYFNMNESRINKILSNYFEYGKNELVESSMKRKNRLITEERKVRDVVNKLPKICENSQQYLMSKQFIKENKQFNLVGKTNTKCIVFENKGKQFKINPNGFVI